MALWRRLRGAGAASLLNGAWVLPAGEEHAALFAQLAETARAHGGDALVLAGASLSEGEREAVVGRFRGDRARDYDEFADRAGGVLAEIAKETDRCKLTHAELEEIEDDLAKLGAWLARIRARDFYPGERHREATELLGRCEAAVRAFADAVYAAEGVVPASPDERPPP